MPSSANRLGQAAYFSVFSSSEETTEREFVKLSFQWEETHTLLYEGVDSLSEMDVTVGYAAYGPEYYHWDKAAENSPHCEIQPRFFRRYVKSVFGVEIPLVPPYRYPRYGQVLPDWLDWLLSFVDSGEVISIESTTESEWFRFEEMFEILFP